MEIEVAKEAGKRQQGAARCAFCHEELAGRMHVSCPSCEALLHGECHVQNGGCATLGCSMRGQGTRAADVLRRQGVRRRAGLVALGGLGAGAAGMVLSFLALALGFLPGAAGFVAGALLVVAGLLALTILGRGRREPVAALGASPRAALGLLSRSTLVAGAAGMALSFLFFTSRHTIDLAGGAAGFVSGALLVLGGLVSLALLTVSDDEPEA